MAAVLETERLILRNWEKNDIFPFIEMCADPKVMEFLSAPLSAEESRSTAGRIRTHFKKYGFGLYAVEKRESKKFIGFIGFMIPNFEHYFTPCVEIGWRIQSDEWNQGFATEGAMACLQFGFSELGFKKIHSFTSVRNLASQRVMQKIGLIKKETFYHPMLPPDHSLSEHILYCTE